MTVKGCPRIVSADPHAPLESTPRLAPGAKVIGKSCKLGGNCRGQLPGPGSWLCREPAGRMWSPQTPPHPWEVGMDLGPLLELWVVQRDRYIDMI